MDKHPLTIRLDDDLLKVVKAQAAQTRSSLGSVIVDATRQALTPEYRENQEQTVLKAMDRCFNRLVKMHEDQQIQHELVREMLAMFVRTFFRHTPAVKPEHREVAAASAARRFEAFLDALAANRRNRLSVMDPAPKQEMPKPPAAPKTNGTAAPKHAGPEDPPINLASLFGK
jgi:hypothetical protein